MLRVTCPNCRRTLGVPKGTPGRVIRCRYCQHVSRIPDWVPERSETRSRTGTWIAGGIVGVAMMAGLAVGGFLLFSGDDPRPSVAEKQQPPPEPAPPPPEALGPRLPDQPLQVSLPAESDRTVRKPVRKLADGSPTDSPIAVSPDGRTLYGLDSRGNLGAWDLESGTVTKPVTGPGRRVVRFALSPDGRRIAEAGTENNAGIFTFLRVRELPSLSVLSEVVLEPPTVEPVGVDFSPDGGRVLLIQNKWGVTSLSATLRIFDAATGREIAAGAGPEFRFNPIARFAADGRAVLVEPLAEPHKYEPTGLDLWHPGEGAERVDPVYRIPREDRMPAGLRAMTLSADRGRAALVYRKRIHVIDIPTRRPGWIIERPALAPRGSEEVLGFSPDGTHLFAAGQSAEGSRPVLHLFDLTTGTESCRFEIPSANLADALIRPGGRELITTGRRGIEIWAIPGPGEAVPAEEPAKPTPKPSTTPKKPSRPAAPELIPGKPLGTPKFQFQTRGEYALLPLPGARGMLIGRSDGDIEFLQPDGTDADAEPLTGHKAAIIHLGLSGDGKRLISVSEDGWVRTWDWSAGKLLAQRKESTTGSPPWATLSSDGKLAMTVTGGIPQNLGGMRPGFGGPPGPFGGQPPSGGFDVWAAETGESKSGLSGPQLMGTSQGWLRADGGAILMRLMPAPVPMGDVGQWKPGGANVEPFWPATEKMGSRKFTSVAVSADGTRLAARSMGPRELLFADALSGRVIRAMTVKEVTPFVAISADGKRACCLTGPMPSGMGGPPGMPLPPGVGPAGGGGMIQVIDLEDGIELGRAELADVPMRAAFSPDGTYLLTWGRRQAQVWDLTGR